MRFERKPPSYAFAHGTILSIRRASFEVNVIDIRRFLFVTKQSGLSAIRCCHISGETRMGPPIHGLFLLLHLHTGIPWCTQRRQHLLRAAKSTLPENCVCESVSPLFSFSFCLFPKGEASVNKICLFVASFAGATASLPSSSPGSAFHALVQFFHFTAPRPPAPSSGIVPGSVL